MSCQLYFDYGIMTRSRMRDKIGEDVEVVGGARLKGFRLTFGGQTALFDGCARAMLRKGERAKKPVYGMLYAVSKDHRLLLDIAMEETFGLSARQTVCVVDGCGREWFAFCYGPTHTTRGRPSCEYRRLHEVLKREARETYERMKLKARGPGV